MSANSLAGRINKSKEEAESIIDTFYKGFKGVKKLTDDSQKMLKEKGYVTDMWGRRRHIPDAQLPNYTVRLKRKKDGTFNPLLGSILHEDKAIQAKLKQYEDKMNSLKWKRDKDAVVAQAKKEGIEIINNQGFISRAFRQCLNARIQGTAASMTKHAMVMINEDQELNELGFELLTTIHDEVFGQAPIENADKAAKRLSEVMVAAAKDKCVCPFKCDPYEVIDGWYEDENIGNIKNDFIKLTNNGMSKDDAINKICDKLVMFNKDSVIAVCNDNYEIGRDSLKYGLNYFKESN